MKYVIIAITLIVSLGIKAQNKTGNFILDDSKISWQKVYETSMTKEEIIAYFQTSKLFKKPKIEGNKIIAQLIPQATDPKKTGIAGVMPLVNKNDFTGLVIIEIKDKKYRIIIQDLMLVGRGDFLKKGEKQTFEENFLKKGISEYRPSFFKSPQRVYNITFDTLFIIEGNQDKDDW
jgi:hypothetical protein